MHFVTAQQAIDYRCHCEEGGAVSAAGVTDCHSPSGFAMTVVDKSLCADFERVVIDGASAGTDSALQWISKEIPKMLIGLTQHHQQNIYGNDMSS